MNNSYIINDFTNFNLGNLSLSQPTPVQGGSYFTKLKNNGNSFYIQLPKCISKQGLVETNKKTYLDLMFTGEDYELIEWFENLETKVQSLVFDKRNLWFENDLEMDDIENAFAPTTRAYKGGKFHLVRVNIQKNKNLNIYNCSIFDENENKLDFKDLDEKKEFITILEVQGIRFSSKSFQLEIVAKQIMVVKTEEIFNTCLIKNSLGNVKPQTTNNKNTLEETNNEVNNTSYLEKTIVVEPENKMEDTINNTHENNQDVKSVNVEEVDNNLENTDDIIVDNTNDNNLDNTDNNNDDDNNDDNNKIKESVLTNENENENEILQDLTVNFNEIEETNSMTIKKPNEVYLEIYKIARQKAKLAKKAAIEAYLESKKIKKQFDLEDLESSDESSYYTDDSDYDDNDDTDEEAETEVQNIIQELS